MTEEIPLYLGFDLSTQQLKGVAVTSDLRVTYEAVFDFDVDAADYGIKKGVLSNEVEREVFAPVMMWLRGVDTVLQRLQDRGMDFKRVRGISGAGQQHGSVYWSRQGELALQNLDGAKPLEAQLYHAFSYPYPNWQDASTQTQCDSFDRHLGDEFQLASHTGSKAHHRFTGPQILRFRLKHPDEYLRTSRISLVSSFLASIFLGKVAPIDIADICGMNLFDIRKGCYNQELMALAAGSSDLESMLGQVSKDSGGSLGGISRYFVQRYGFNSSCVIIPFTGDNPSTILALPLRPLDAIVSLGTSTTFLMSTSYYKPDPAVHLMNHPTTPGLYMFMLCYKNGGLAREQVRDALPPKPPDSTDRWSLFNHYVTHTRPLGALNESSPAKIALFFPLPEIIPNVRAGTYRYTYTANKPTLSSPSAWKIPEDDCRAIIESQFLSLRLRSREVVAPPSSSPKNVPAQPRRIYLVGGGSQNTAIAKIAGEILGGVEGVYRLDVGRNACALGSAYKAVWAVEKEPRESFEGFISNRWREDDFAEKIADGYQEERFQLYEKGVSGCEAIEEDVLKLQAMDTGKAGTSGAGQH